MARWHLACLLAASLMSPWPTVAAETKIKDTESASHSGEPAWLNVVDTYRLPGFEVVQLNLGVLSHYRRILTHDDEHDLRSKLAERGFHPLLADGFEMVAEGTTSLSELRMLGSSLLPPTGTASAELLERCAAAIGSEG